MALRAKKPEAIQKRLKVLFYGEAGVGKTTAAIQFPRPYLIDTERGAENTEYVEHLKKSGGVIFQTSDYSEVLQEIKELLSTKHEYKTLIIDPLTVIYNDLVEKWGAKVGQEFGRHYNEANKELKKLLVLILRLDMNVILISHAKEVYGDKMNVIGITYDCYKKLNYICDLIFEVRKIGKERIAFVKKTRNKPQFQEGEQFNFSYDAIAEKYDRSILEKDSMPISLANIEQVSELNRLIDLLKIPGDHIEKWLAKATATEFSEMSSEDIQKCIDMLNKKLTTKGE